MTWPRRRHALSGVSGIALSLGRMEAVWTMDMTGVMRRPFGALMGEHCFMAVHVMRRRLELDVNIISKLYSLNHYCAHQPTTHSLLYKESRGLDPSWQEAPTLVRDICEDAGIWIGKRWCRYHRVGGRHLWTSWLCLSGGRWRSVGQRSRPL